MKGRGAEKPKGDSREAGHSQEMGWGGARDATKLKESKPDHLRS